MDEEEFKIEKRRVKLEPKIFIGNLDFTAKNENLIALCRKFGPIKSVAIVKDPETDRSKGYGFVEFDSMRSAQNALALNGTKYLKRFLNVSMAEPETTEKKGSK